MNLRFDADMYQGCLSDPSDISQTPQPLTWITAESVHRHGAIRLGTMVIGSMAKGGLYTTHDDSVFARAPLPYTNGLIWLEGSRGLEHQMSGVIGLHRLGDIAQLSLLAFPVIEGSGLLSMSFQHNRFLHTYDVIVLGLLCAQNLGVSGTELLALNIALAIHDLFTPACGDLMKFIDFNRFDEDAMLSTLLVHEGYTDMCEKLGVDPALPINICQNKDGVLCKIRDFADTLAYTARDLSVFMGCLGSHSVGGRKIYNNEFDEALLHELAIYAPNADFALLFEDIAIDSNGNLVFNNPDRLHKFLRVRAILFRILYYHQQTRNIEYLLGIRLVKILLEEGVLDLEMFHAEMVADSTIWSKVYQTTGYNPSFVHRGDIGHTRQFGSLEDAQVYVQNQSSPNTCGLIYRWPSATKSKVNYWHVPYQGSSAPWGQAFSIESQGIENIMRLPDCYYVAIIRQECLQQITPVYWARLQSVQTSAL